MEPSSSKLSLPPNLQSPSKESRMRRIFAGLAVASFLMLGFSSAAYAYDPMKPMTCDNGDNPPPDGFSGDINISVVGGCVSGSLSASGNISVATEGGDITIGSISAGGNVSNAYISGAPAGNTTIGAITGSAVSIGGASVSLTGDIMAGQTITLSSGSGGITFTGTNLNGPGLNLNSEGSVNIGGTINASGSGTNGVSVDMSAWGNLATGPINAVGVTILANQQSASAPVFEIGNSSSNGIGGKLTLTGTSSTGGILNVTNGNNNSGASDIKVDDMSYLALTGSSNGGGQLYMWGVNGTVTIPSGTLTLDGPNSVFWLQGKTVNFGAGGATNISVGTAGVASKHKLRIDANTINYNGNLALKADGDGSSSSQQGFVYIYSYNKYFSLPSTVSTITFNGTGSSAFLAEANGDQCYVEATANQMTFNGAGAVTLKSQGTGNQYVELSNPAPTASTYLTVNNTGSFLLDASGATGGAGGDAIINVGAVSIQSSNFTVNASGPTSGNGAGGPINYTAFTTALNSASALNAYSEGSGISSGGAIKIITDGTLNLTSSTYSVSGNGTGSSGSIEIGHHSGTLALTSGPMTANGGTGAASTGTGGTINLHDLAQFSAGGSITANGGGAGLAGTIEITQTGTGANMNLSGATLSASGDPAGGGSGNIINLSSSSGITFDSGTALHADASGTSNAFGGTIRLTSAGQLIPPDSSRITANGATQGAGGNVILSNSGSFDVNGVINVDAGTSTAVDVFDGSIQLNSVVCQQWKTGISAAFPKSYWDCANPTAPNEFSSAPATFAATTTTIQNADSIIGIGRAYLYVFNTFGNFNSYFKSTAAAEWSGATISKDNGAEYPSVFLTWSNNGHTASATELNSTTAHELGHTVDEPYSISVRGSTYDTAIATRDFLNLDYIFTGTNDADPSDWTKRDACMPYNGIKAPFADVSAVCTGTVVNSDFALLYNSEIAQTAGIAQYVMKRKTDGSWADLYANSFAFQSYDKGLPQASWPYHNTDLIINAGYFQCTQAVATALVTGMGVSYPAGLNCGTPAPAWYTRVN